MSKNKLLATLNKNKFFWNAETNHLTSGHCIIAEIKHAGNVFHLILVPKFDSLV